MDTGISYPSRIHLAQTPTPLQKMEHLSRKYGTDIYFKRDDYTGSELSGNKIRKLEFILAEARANGVDTVLTCGGAQSNHCRATAVAAKRAGMDSLLLLRTADPENPPSVEGNILLDCLVGASIVWITPDQYKQREIYFEQEAEKLKAKGKNPCIIPEGGSTALGAWGYIAAMDEISSDLKQLDGDEIKQTTVISATGSGGTTAGLILGNRLLGMDLRVVGVNVCDDRDHFVNIIGEICSDFSKKYELEDRLKTGIDIEILDGYVGRGYALSRPEELEAIRDLAMLEGVVLDPVYTGKAFFGMISELEKDPAAFGPRIVFVHTGGLFGLFPIADQLASVMS